MRETGLGKKFLWEILSDIDHMQKVCKIPAMGTLENNMAVCFNTLQGCILKHGTGLFIRVHSAEMVNKIKNRFGQSV